MFNPYDPRRVYLDPNSSSTSIPFSYATASSSSQVPLGPRPEGNIVYLTPGFTSQVPGTSSASSSTAELVNPQLLGTQAASQRTGEASTAATTSASVSIVNLMQPAQPLPNISYDPARMGTGTTASFPRYLATQPTFSQSNTPLQAAQPQMLQQPIVLQANSPSPTFAPSGAAATSPGSQRLMLISGPAPARSMNPFYPYRATAAGAPAAMQSSSSHHSPATTTQLISPLQVASHASQSRSGSGNFAYVVESGSPAPLLAYSMPQQSFVPVTNPPWSPGAALSVLSSASGTPTMAPRKSNSGVEAASLRSSAQQSLATSVVVGSQNNLPGTSPASPDAAPTSMPTARAGGTTAAAGGSPDGIQPAALGVRNFFAPEPVGSCLLPNLPLDPIIPPLALPCPRWGKLPRS
ncbi:hypothetical protein GH5_03800 [Leishmania sp. Ghana 2012 LV757]|uniref:hypothetical protein n=1 Tax=Leishmania sp. Ghana 2012 LV757 TaxID=2803181 RepID=UPI001B74A6CD|nr:hypothetical protein GH5_03800 [Leishmania sp. Ghana 2012 LV757]